jgi:pyruvate/2-oxoglutarate dehydrogenase complex dihydrolipoamide dehydrogenase (E3) component
VCCLYGPHVGLRRVRLRNENLPTTMCGAVDHDLIIIGGGAGGLSAARAAQWVGADTLLVNDGPLGGDCTFAGCVPSKTLLSAARGGLGFDDAFGRVSQTIDRIAATETADVFRSRGTRVLEARARLATHDSIAVGDRRITAPKIIIATGGRPVMPPIPGLDTVGALTNESVFSLYRLPGSITIVGGGAIGCELAEAFARLGTSVTLVDGLPRLLAREEPGASAVVERSLRALGVTVVTGALIERVAPTPMGGVRVFAGGQEIVTDKLLMAVGRAPNAEDLGLDELGVERTDHGHIKTDDRLSTTVRGVYAVGDVTGKLAFTHAADEMGRLAAGNALRKGQRGRYRTHWIPWVTFTSPEVARIGMTETEAAAHGGRVAELPLSEIDRAITDGIEDGFIKLIAGPKRITRGLFGGQLLGATIVSPRAGEMIHEIALAMRAGLFTGRLAQTVHAYPSWSYGIQKVAGQFFGDVEGRVARDAVG